MIRKGWIVLTLILVVGLAGSADAAKNAKKTAEDAKGSPEAVKLIRQVQAKYAELKSYRDDGESVSVMTLSLEGLEKSALTTQSQKKLQEVQKAIQGRKTIVTFTTILARPDLYRVDWEGKSKSGSPRPGTIWSAGKGHFLTTVSEEALPVKDLVEAMARTAGLSGGAASTLPGIFFATPKNLLTDMTGAKLEKDETVDGVDCRVVSGQVAARAAMLWIGKKDLLIHRALRTVGGRIDNTPINDETAKQALAKAGKEATTQSIQRMKKTMELAQAMIRNSHGTVTESHRNIKVNFKTHAKDFAPPQPPASQPTTRKAK